MANNWYRSHMAPVHKICACVWRALVDGVGGGVGRDCDVCILDWMVRKIPLTSPGRKVGKKSNTGLILILVKK